MPARISSPALFASTRRVVAGAAVLALLLGWGGWQAGLWQGLGGGETDAALEPDVCIVAPPTPYVSTSGLPMDAARPVPADVRCPVCGMFPA
ncbi:MAG: nitrous oxide reductase accessory protein NosL, partial [Giesbergeria sp.]